MPVRSCMICCRPLCMPYSAARPTPLCAVYSSYTALLGSTTLMPFPSLCYPSLHPRPCNTEGLSTAPPIYYLSQGSGLARLSWVAHPLHVVLAPVTWRRPWAGTAAVAHSCGWQLGAQRKLSVGGCIRVCQGNNH